MTQSIDGAVTPDSPADNQPAAPTGGPVRVQMLGGSGVGKTCFLAGLALLNEQSAGKSFVLPTDDASKAVFDKLRATLGAGRWPAKTSIVDSLSFAVVRGRTRVDVELTDFAGESFSDAMQRGNATAAAKQVQDLVAQADVLLVLLDGAAVDRGTEFSGAPLIQAVFERLSQESHVDLEVAVVLTKSDLCVKTPVRNGDDLQQIVAARAVDLARFLSEQSLHTQWIPASVCGPRAIDEAGLPIYAALAPQGYEAIFDLLFRRRARAGIRRLKLIAAAVILILVTACGWMMQRESRIQNDAKQIQDPTKTIAELPEAVAAENQDLLRRRYADDVNQAIQEIESAGNTDSITLVLERFKQIPPGHASFVFKDIERLQSRALQRKEQLLHKGVVDCQQLNSGDCVPLIEKYLSEFPDGKNAESLRQMHRDLKQSRYLSARGRVKSVTVGSAAALKQKIEAIDDFLKEWSEFVGDKEQAALTLARDTAQELITSRQYHCELIRTSGLDTPRDHGVQIFVNNDRIANFDDSGDVSEKNWNRKFTLDWKSGDKIRVTLVNFDNRNQDMAYFENNTPLAIALLAKERTPSRYATTEKWFGVDFTKSRPPFKIKFKCDELPPEKLQALEDYLLPGDKW